MNNLTMLEMALTQLKACSSNEWVDGKAGKRYNIDAALAKLNKLDIIKWTAIIIVIVLLFYIGRTKTVEDYERGMDSQSSTLERYKNE